MDNQFKEINVEYLLVISHNSGFCKKESEFLDIMTASSDLNVDKSENKIYYKNKNYQFKYYFEYGSFIDDKLQKGQSYANFKLSCSFEDSNMDTEQIDKFSDLIGALDRFLNEQCKISGGKICDDLSKYYSSKAYCKIHELENLLRKIITIFMTKHLGKEWPNSYLPKKLRESIENTKKNQNENPELDILCLYYSDFKDLSHFLFENSPLKDINLIKNDISKINSFDELDLNLLKEEYCDNNNWNRFFEESISVDSNKLKEKWDILYHMRCKVAHNREFSKKDYSITLSSIKFLKGIFENTLDKIGTIDLPEYKKELMVETVEQNRSENKITGYKEYYKKSILELGVFFKIYSWESYEKIDFSTVNLTLAKELLNDKIITPENYEIMLKIPEYFEKAYDPKDVEKISYDVSKFIVKLDLIKELFE
ncbi:hypothetical protein [Methanococcus maripaludis]|uniref:Apea-like HEPN domain-containing protein n=1 Tax=Methanococcus maripaludis TaxID=39152 RepID=A0A7J9S7E8_METMI|nr:hypothetical protein [Methanococcus maripaludis]MBB6496007.1 hypothetical protein [Methanococcus maripaludis]